jgi:hypothetical protein
MDILSISPFRTGSVLWRPRPDRWTLTVVCKATYALEPGESPLASDQEGVNQHDGYWDDDPRRSVHAPNDLAPFKPRADVTLVGHAYAPRSEMVRSLVARLMVGDMEKAVEVLCPRVVGREGELREGARWNKMPLRYEYAAGGLDTWNPVGIGPSAPVDAYGQRPLPHLQPPGLRVTPSTSWRDVFVPTGFGPISSSWRLRRDKLGRRIEGWSDEGWTQIALDDDFDGEFFQVAPPDQQIDALRDDERLVLEYLHPDHPSLTTKLPGVHPRAFVEIPGTPTRDLVMTADTLWIDTDRALCTMTWRGQVAVDGPDQPGRVLIAIEEAGQNLDWTAMAGLRTSSGTLVPDPPEAGRREMLTLPFVTPDLLADRPKAVHEQPSPPREDAGDPVATPRTAPRVSPEAEVQPAPEPPGRPGPRKTLPMVAEALPPQPGWARSPASPDALSVVAPTAHDGIPRTLLDQGRPALPAIDGYPPVPGRERAPTQVSVQLDAFPAMTRPPAITERAFELVWFAPALGARLRREAAFARVLASEAAPPEPSAATTVAAVLARGTPTGAHLEHALFEAAGGDGALVPPLLLLAGEISLPFDEVEELRALIVAARPARADLALAGLLDFAEEMSATELQGSPEVADGLCTSLRDAWAQANKVLPAGHLGQQVERALLFRRAYQRRELLGKRWIRALFTHGAGGGGDPRPIPAYLPAAAAARVPLFRHFPARILAEVHPQQDQSERSPVALGIAAVAREVSRRP